MKSIVPILLIVLLNSCSNNGEMLKLFPMQKLTGNSAKVWVLSSSNRQDANTVSSMKEYRKTFTFYNNNTFKEQQYIRLGSKMGGKGNFNISFHDSGDFCLTFIYENKKKVKWNIESISNSKLVLKRGESSLLILQFRSLQPPSLE